MQTARGRGGRLFSLALLTLSCLRPFSGHASEEDAPASSIPDILAISDEMRAAALSFAGTGSPTARLKQLQLALFDPERFTFDYEAHTTLTAREAFESRRGNCVAFTNLFVALARSAGIPVSAGLVRKSVGSDLEGDLVVVRNHVVVVLPLGGRYLLYDFSRDREDVVGRVRLLTDRELLAVALANRSVEALLRGDLPAALSDQNLAVSLAPGLASMEGNLGALLARQGDVEGAFAAYQRALLVDAHSPAVLHNLAVLHRSRGNLEEARRTLSRIDEGGASPHTLLMKGDLELAAGKVGAALSLYRNAQALSPRSVQPLLSIARAELVRGQEDSARRALRLANDVAPQDPAVTLLLSSLSDVR